MKIFISYPPLEGPGHPTLGQNRQFQWFSNRSSIYPLVPASAATLLKAEGYDAVWDDCIARQKTGRAFFSRIKQEKPQVVAMETKTPVVRQHWAIAEKIKDLSPDTKIVLMGDHVTAEPVETMTASVCDYAITGGHYDVSLWSVVKHIESARPLGPGIYYRHNDRILCSEPDRSHQIDLDQLPRIDRRLTRWYDYGEKLYRRRPFTYIAAGRDCPYGKCTFCSWTTLFPRFRVRSPENVVDEIEYLVKEFGIRELFDDTGTFPSGGWLERFCRLMMKKNLHSRVLISCNFRYDYLTRERAKMMKRAGFRLMKMGLESANQATLDRLNKGTRVDDIEKGCQTAKDAGMEVHLTMMVGYPWEKRSDAQRTLDLARRLMKKGSASMLQATVITPYPGTPLFEEALKENWFTVDPKDYDKMDMSEPILKTPDMTSKQVTQLCRDIYKSFLSPQYIFNQAKMITSIEDLSFLFRGIKPLFGHLNDFGSHMKRRLRFG